MTINASVPELVPAVLQALTILGYTPGGGGGSAYALKAANLGDMASKSACVANLGITLSSYGSVGNMNNVTIPDVTSTLNEIYVEPGFNCIMPNMVNCNIKAGSPFIVKGKIGGTASFNLYAHDGTTLLAQNIDETHAVLFFVADDSTSNGTFTQPITATFQASVLTINQLKAMKNIADNTLVDVVGFGIYRFVLGDVSAADNITVVADTANTGRFFKITADRININPTVITADRTIVANDINKFFRCSSSTPFTITLPTGLNSGFEFFIDNVGSAQVYIVAPGSTLFGAIVIPPFQGPSPADIQHLIFNPRVVGSNVWYTGIPGNLVKTINSAQSIGVADMDCTNLCSNASAFNLTIPVDPTPPANTIQVGQVSRFICTGAGQVSFVITAGVTVYCALGVLTSTSGITPRISQGNDAFLEKIAANTYFLGGNITS